MAQIDLFQYRDFTVDWAEPPPVGTPAERLFGQSFAGLFVAAVGPPVHDGRAASVVLSHEARPEMQQQLKRFFGPHD